MSRVSIAATAGDKIAVTSPYDAGFVAGARALHGAFANGVWTFDGRDLDRIRALCMEVYGTTGETAAESDVVTVRVTLTEYPHGAERDFRLAGRRLAWRPGRDSRVLLGDGVVVIDGAFPSSGGSVKNPRLDNRDPVVLEVRDLPLTAAQKMIAERPTCVEIITDVSVVRTALLAERAQLISRLRAVDAELGLDTAELLDRLTALAEG